MTTRDIDLKELEDIAPKIEAAKTQLAILIDRRRLLWDRRLNVAKDTTKAELARRSSCHSMNVTQGLKPELVKKAKKR